MPLAVWAVLPRLEEHRFFVDGRFRPRFDEIGRIDGDDWYSYGLYDFAAFLLNHYWHEINTIALLGPYECLSIVGDMLRK